MSCFVTHWQFWAESFFYFFFLVLYLFCTDPKNTFWTLIGVCLLIVSPAFCIYGKWTIMCACCLLWVFIQFEYYIGLIANSPIAQKVAVILVVFIIFGVFLGSIYQIIVEIIRFVWTAATAH